MAFEPRGQSLESQGLNPNAEEFGPSSIRKHQEMFPNDVAEALKNGTAQPVDQFADAAQAKIDSDKLSGVGGTKQTPSGATVVNG